MIIHDSNIAKLHSCYPSVSRQNQNPTAITRIYSIYVHVHENRRHKNTLFHAQGERLSHVLADRRLNTHQSVGL